MDSVKDIWTKPNLIALDTNLTEDASKVINSDGVGLGTQSLTDFFKEEILQINISLSSIYFFFAIDFFI